MSKKMIIPSQGEPLYAIGKNAETLQLHEHFKVAGILDDFAVEGSLWHGIPLLKVQDIPSDSMVVNTSTSIAPVSAAARVKQVAPEATLYSYYQLAQHFPNLLAQPGFVQEMQADWASNSAKWTWLKEVLADEASKKTLQDIIDFRLSGDIEVLSSYQAKTKEQYFDPLVSLGEDESFVDCGGFDGDTTEAFIQRNPRYGRIWFFEPSPVNMAKAKARLAPYDKIEYLPYALSNRSETLYFDPDAGSASSVRAEGKMQVEAVALDEAVKGCVTFIKMDLEGSELLALAGSKRHIVEERPKLAIAAYHRASDFWQIPEIVLGFCTGYEVFLRHYTEGWSESVLYFKPV